MTQVRGCSLIRISEKWDGSAFYLCPWLSSLSLCLSLPLPLFLFYVFPNRRSTSMKNNLFRIFLIIRCSVWVVKCTRPVVQCKNILGIYIYLCMNTSIYCTIDLWIHLHVYIRCTYILLHTLNVKYNDAAEIYAYVAQPTMALMVVRDCTP